MTEIQGKSILIRVSASFELARVRVIGSRLVQVIAWGPVIIRISISLVFRIEVAEQFFECTSDIMNRHQNGLQTASRFSRQGARMKFKVCQFFNKIRLPKIYNS